MMAIVYIMGAITCFVLCMSACGNLLKNIFKLIFDKPGLRGLWGDTIAQGNYKDFFIVMLFPIIAIIFSLAFITLTGWGAWTLVGMV